MPDTDPFYETLEPFGRFAGVSDLANYRPLPDDWVLVTADIVDSTEALKAGRYKAVNMAGAAVIAALVNARGGADLPFVFGGDGATVAVPGSFADAARAVLAAVVTWAAEEIGLTMRGAIVPLAEIRRAGLDVRVARFQASDQVSYAMFAGGGVAWAEAEMKAGRFAVPPAAPGTRPDLAGLSCRWNPVGTANGEIVSIIAVPEPGADPARFAALVAAIAGIIAGTGDGGNPVAPDKLRPGYPRASVALELKTVRPGERLRRWLKVHLELFLVAVLHLVSGRIGGFDIAVYRQDLASNSDFRKFDDGLKLTLDIDSGRRAAIEALLDEASRAGLCRYGLLSQDAALITCFVTTPLARDHVHFVDGAAGGYAMAAARLKQKARA